MKMSKLDCFENFASNFWEFYLVELRILFIFAAEKQKVMYKRPQFQELKSRIPESRSKIQVISGPRQVGKSTMVKQVLQEIDIPYMLVSADNIDHTNTAWIGEMWATARARMKVARAKILYETLNFLMNKFKR